MTWMRVLTYLRAYNWSGSLIRMITAILYKMTVFFVILMLLFAGYTCAFSVLFPLRLEFRGARGRLFVRFFEAMLGDPMMYSLYNDDDLKGTDVNETVLQEFLKVATNQAFGGDCYWILQIDAPAPANSLSYILDNATESSFLERGRYIYES